MRRLIRKIVNWAYGENFTSRVFAIELGKFNLATLVYDIEMRRKMDYSMLNDELSNIRHILNNHERKLNKK